MAITRIFFMVSGLVASLSYCLALTACLSPATICVAGNYSPCQCPDGSSGNRRCNAEGSAFESSCICDLQDYSNAARGDVQESLNPDSDDATISERSDIETFIDSGFSDTGFDTETQDVVQEEDSSVNDAGAIELPCNEDPWKCPDGQTCWLGGEPASDGSWDGTFECLNSRPNGKAGCSCNLKIGIPSCADDLYCLILLGEDAPAPHCTFFCDNKSPDHACPVGFYCGPVSVSSQTINLCIPESGSLVVEDCSISP